MQEARSFAMSMDVCRACLGAEATVSVFVEYGGEDLGQRLAWCGRVQVPRRGDGLPARVCASCERQLDAFARLAACVARADQQLRGVKAEAAAEPHFDVKEELHFKEEVSDSGDRYDESFLFKEDPPPDEIVSRKSSPVPAKKQKKKIKRGKAGPVQCVVCGLMTACRSALETHMRTHTGDKPFPCDACQQHFATKGALKRHIGNHHTQRQRPFTCETCGSSFYTRNDIAIHMRIHTDEKPYVCPYCSKAFRQTASLIRHKRMHTGEKPYACSVCGKKFSSSTLVNKHMHVHSDERKYSCHLCHKAVKTKSALTAHLNTHSDDKKYICNVCGVALGTKGNLQAHIRRRHSERSGLCSVCQRTFSDVAEHMRRHTGSRPLHCACGQAFATQRALSHHRAFKHSTSKHHCPEDGCSRAFPTALMLQFHRLKTHSQRPPLACAHCQRGFYRASDLSRHLRCSHATINNDTKPELNNCPLETLGQTL